MTSREVTRYTTWEESEEQPEGTVEPITATDAPPGVVLVPMEEYDRLREEMRKVLMHTARVRGTTDVELLNGLLDSCGRIASTALQEDGDE